MSDERRPTINIYASKHRGKTAEAKRRKDQSERDRESAAEKGKTKLVLTNEQLEAAEIYNFKEREAGRLTSDHVAIAVASFQSDNDLAVDGMAGPVTRDALEKANEPEREPARPGLPEGKGMFVRELAQTGEPSDMIQTMEDNGIQWVCVQRIWQYKDKDSSLRNGAAVWAGPSRMVEYAEAVHAAGFGFWLWGYPVPGKHDEFAQVILSAARECLAQGVMIDPEAPYKNTTGEGTKLMLALMPGCIEQQILLGVTSYGAPWYHADFPWREFSTAHFAVPQNYDAENNLGTDYPVKSHEAYRDYGYSVIVPASGAWGKTEEQMTELLENTPTPQGSIIWWDWYNANSSGLWGPIAALTVSKGEQ